MARRGLKKIDKEDVEYEGIMRLVEGIMLHVLDSVSISGKWLLKDISMKTLLAKKQTINEMREWMKGEQWAIWVGIYSEHNKYNNHIIKRKFELIRKESIKYVHQRIKAKMEKDKAQNVDEVTIG